MQAAGMAMTPFNPVTGAAMIAAGTVSGHQTFHIQPDQLPRVLAGLDEVLAKYELAREQAAQLANVTPPFGDDVTVAAFKKISERAQGGEGCLYDTAQGMIDWVNGFKAAVQKAIEDHQRIDEENRMA
ncbi:hypothetical protein [Saccharopolyspora phatthalungensis]|uniref:PE domain-containing protein n=1 Tax=Saccharopolyspora phatthalungensis TaxID=664693 RepID=A0A840QK56_9PSEU|nr:hypothetical protein [Saccharopolyspora phatthalungensis]MBB5159615.1 hypothetical protein [Saccharopolyspora phatthalungensis]